jgi:hypothetical protein
MRATNFAELAAQLRGLGKANSSEAAGCVAGEEERHAACQGAAQAHFNAAEMVEAKLRRQSSVSPRKRETSRDDGAWPVAVFPRQLPLARFAVLVPGWLVVPVRSWDWPW